MSHSWASVLRICLGSLEVRKSSFKDFETQHRQRHLEVINVPYGTRRAAQEARLSFPLVVGGFRGPPCQYLHPIAQEYDIGLNTQTYV